MIINLKDMEFYKRISVQALPPVGVDLDDFHTDLINKAILKWAKEKKISFWRVLNAETFKDFTKSHMPGGIQGAYTIVHIAYVP